MSDLNEFNEGPLSMLKECVETLNKVIIDIGGKGDKKLIARVISFDHTFNMILCDVVEEWTERRGRVLEHKKRYLSNLFLPGHNVRVIVKVTD